MHSSAGTLADPTPSTVNTRIGELAYEVWFPTRETVEKPYNERDFQRAVSAYEYAACFLA